jgi:hypothetical protein
MRTPSRRRRAGLSALVALALVAASLVLGTSAAGAVDVKPITQQVWGTTGTIDVTPHPASSNNSTVTITLTAMANYLGTPLVGGTSVAVSFCGNFLSDGVTPLTEAQQNAGAAPDAGQAYCDGTQDLFTHTFPFLSTTGSGLTATKELRSGSGVGTTLSGKPNDGIGNQDAQCLPGGLTTCKVAIATTSNTNPGGQDYAIKIPVFGGPAPAATTLTATNEAARVGQAVNFTGVDFDASVSTGTASLCDTDGTTGCQALTGTSISTDGSGALTGSGTVPAGATTGARKLVVSTGTQSASDDFVVLGTAAISLSASSGGVGSTVTVSGSNFDPGKTLFVSPTDGSGPTGSVAMVTTSATGSFSGASVTVNAGTVAITATTNPPDGINLASQPFVLSANSCIVTATNCTITQTIEQPVTGGALSMSQTAALISMSPVTLDGTPKTGTGALNQVTVTDARGSLSGWTLTGSVTPLTTGAGGTNRTIPADQVSWTPACGAASGSNAAEVVAGSAGAIPTNSALCTAASGGGGGTFTADAGITVSVAPSVAAGLYTGTLTLTLTGQ